MIRKKESVEWCNYICTSQRLTQYKSVWSFEGVSSRKFNLLISRHSNKVNVKFCSLNVKSWNYSRNNYYAKFGFCSWQRISHVPLLFLWKTCLYIELYWLSNGICWTDRQLSKERIMEHEKSVVKSTFHNAYADHLGDSGYQFDYNFEILHSENKSSLLTLLKCLEINKFNSREASSNDRIIALVENVSWKKLRFPMVSTCQ